MTTADETRAAAGDDLFDKYTLPKVALTVILAASLLGTAASVGFAGGATIDVAGTWLHLVGLAVATGGLLWKHAFVRPADLDDGAGAYCERMYDRFDRIATATAIVLVPASALVVRRYVAAGAPTALVAALAAAVAVLVALVVREAVRSRPVDAQFRSAAGLAALAAATAAVIATAVGEVLIRGGDPAAVAVRAVHLLAFSVWLGGAVWNIFVAVPTGQERPTAATARAAGQQLERFRWAVRFVIPAILATGLYQAVDALGASLDAYLASPLGLAVLAKAGTIGVLVVIFKLCPMWRACSPIDGVCDLEDLGDPADDGGVPDD